MGLSDDIYKCFEILYTKYRDDYTREGIEYVHKKQFEELLFTILKTLYICNLPDQSTCAISFVPTDEWIKNHIDSLLYDD